MEIRVFLLDDQPILRIGLRTVLEHAQDIALQGELIDFADLESSSATPEAAVLILAHRLTNASSLQVTQAVVRSESKIQVLAYGPVTDDPFVNSMLAAGAMGYALTTDEPDELVEAVRSVASGQVWLSPQIRAQTFARIDRELAGIPALTDREREVLHLIGKGLTNREIAEVLNLQWQTVKNYILRVYQKLGVNSRSQAMLRAIRLGLVDLD